MSETPWPAKGCELYGHSYYGKRPCRCGAPYVELTDVEQRIMAAVKYSLPDVASRDQSAENLARRVSRALNLTQEHRTLPDGEGGMTTDYKTGATTVHIKPATVQSRWATEWRNTTVTLDAVSLTIHQTAKDIEQQGD